MKQPKIIYGEWPSTSGNDGRYQIANHWNIAKGHIEKLQSIINHLYLDERVVLPFDVQRAISSELGNAAVGIHNLGQALTEVKGYEYDFSTAEVSRWENPDKSIYANRVKKYNIEPINK